MADWNEMIYNRNITMMYVTYFENILLNVYGRVCPIINFKTLFCRGMWTSCNGSPYMDLQCTSYPILACYYIPCLCLGIILDVDGLTTHKEWPQEQQDLHSWSIYATSVRNTLHMLKILDCICTQGFQLDYKKTTNSCPQIIWWLHVVYCDVCRISYNNIKIIRAQPWFNL